MGHDPSKMVSYKLLVMKNLAFVVSFIALCSCESGVEPIKYGEDECSFCRMKIMDPKFGSEAVTDKGRVYKFDSGECLIHYLNENNGGYKYLAVTDYDNPNSLIHAESAWYLISEKMPSPMGAYLNAFSSKEIAESVMQSVGGELYDWQNVKLRFQKKE